MMSENMGCAMSGRTRREAMILGVGAVGALAAGAGPVAAAGRVPVRTSPAATWQLRWAPTPAADGLNAFEGLEDDRSGSHPGGTVHKVDLWRDINYLRPKWGIYRSIESPGLRNCYQLTRIYRAYQLV